MLGADSDILSSVPTFQRLTAYRAFADWRSNRKPINIRLHFINRPTEKTLGENKPADRTVSCPAFLGRAK